MTLKVTPISYCIFTIEKNGAIILLHENDYLFDSIEAAREFIKLRVEQSFIKKYDKFVILPSVSVNPC